MTISGKIVKRKRKREQKWEQVVFAQKVVKSLLYGNKVLGQREREKEKS